MQRERNPSASGKGKVRKNNEKVCSKSEGGKEGGALNLHEMIVEATLCNAGRQPRTHVPEAK